MTVDYRQSLRSPSSLAVVVGAGTMGLSIARVLARSERLLLADIDEDKAKEAANVLTAEGGAVEGIGCDVTSAPSVKHLADAVHSVKGFRCLVHVAGLSPMAGDFDRIMLVNLNGPARVAEALLPMASEGSVAILIASLAAHARTLDETMLAAISDPARDDLLMRVKALLSAGQTTPEYAYLISKSGLVAYAQDRASDWGKRGARIVSLSPGMIASPMGAAEFVRSAGKRQMFTATPLQRQGSLHEIADAVEFLASNRASFITGIDLLVDGGLTAALKRLGKMT